MSPDCPRCGSRDPEMRLLVTISGTMERPCMHPWHMIVPKRRMQEKIAQRSRWIKTARWREPEPRPVELGSCLRADFETIHEILRAACNCDPMNGFRCHNHGGGIALERIRTLLIKTLTRLKRAEG